MSRFMTKPTKWSVRPAKTQISLGIRPVWSESSQCAQWVAEDPLFLHADSEDSDQTGRMSRLIRVFAGRTYYAGTDETVPLLLAARVRTYTGHQMSQGRKKHMARPNPGPLAYRSSTLTTELPSHTADLWQLQGLETYTSGTILVTDWIR